MEYEEPPNDEGGRPLRAALDRSEAWIDAFDEQCTEQLLKAVRRFVAGRAAKDGLDPHYAEELLQDVIGDTASGELRWDPTGKSLLLHVLDAVRWRARRERQRAERYPHVSIDAVDEDRDDDNDEDVCALSPEDEASLEVAARANTAERVERADSDSRAAAIDRRLRELSASDPSALRFLDAVDRGAQSPAEIMRLAKLTRTEYRNARRRLIRLLRITLAEGV